MKLLTQRHIRHPLYRRMVRALALVLRLLIVAIIYFPKLTNAQTTNPTPSPGEVMSTCVQSILLDGDFTDWDCQPFIADPGQDCVPARIDVVTFAFTSNMDDAIAYFMAERWEGGTQPIGLRLALDVNNDGNYVEAVDRLIRVRYEAMHTTSSVAVELYDGSGVFLNQIATNSDWGESLEEGARRVEWGVSFGQLGILAGQPLRMRLESRPGNTSGSSFCDITSEVQWSSADALGPILLIIVVLIGSFWFTQRRRRFA